MDSPSSPATLMCQSFTHRRSCTTQSDPVKPGPGFSDENTIMVMSPQQEMFQPCPRSTQHLSYPPPSYPPQQQQGYTTSPMPLNYLGSPVSSQLDVRTQTWPAPQTSSWPGEASAHALASTGTPRELPWSNLERGDLQHWLPSQQCQQPSSGSQMTDQQPQFYGSAIEETASYSQRESSIEGIHAAPYSYANMAPAATSHAEHGRMEAYSRTTNTIEQSYPPHRAAHLQPPYGDSALTRSMETAQSLAMLSSSQIISDDGERPQSPMSPCSEYSEGPLSGHDVKEQKYGSPSAENDMKVSSVPASPSKPVETPYAQLIYRALMSTPRRAMKLQEIYQWFLENTDKGQPGQGRGWQNSIRHNLSMNGAFERRPIKDEAIDSGDDYLSPSGSSKPATEWVLVDEFVAKGVESTTRYRNASRRSQNKRLRGRIRAEPSSRRLSKRHAPARSTVPGYPYSLPPLQHLEAFPDHRSPGYYPLYTPSYETPADQMERLSLVPGRPYEQRPMYYGRSSDYDQADYHAAATLGSPMGGTNMHSGYSSAPLRYSSELFMPSVPGAPTVASEDDVNEVITPEASFSVLEPTVLLPGETSCTLQGPTSDPHSNNNNNAAYYNSQGTGVTDSQAVTQYTLGDVVGVCDESMLRSCGWNDNVPSRQ